MNTSRTLASLMATLIAIGLAGCDGDDGSSKTQSAAATAPIAAQAPAAPQASSASDSDSTSNPAVAPAPAASEGIGSATVQWSAPQEKADGSVLQNLAGFMIVYGTSANDLRESIRIDNPSIDRYVLDQLPAGTYYFAVRAYDAAGAQSDLSNVMTKVII